MHKYKRIVLKLSGEALKDKKTSQIFDAQTLKSIVKIIKEYLELKIQVSIVVGAGNIWRGKLAKEIGLEVEDADYMGMVATVINAAALKSILIEDGVSAEVLSALAVEKVAKKYTKEEAVELLNKGTVVIFAAGTGKPFYTTDTCAAMRAIDIDADVLLMAKDGVDGVYTSDPRYNKDAKFISKTTYEELITLQVQVMDQKALMLLKESGIDTIVFGMNDPNNFIKVLKDDKIGTHISWGK